MPQNITLDEVYALDDVNVSSPYLNDVTERIDIAYDEGGDRLWYSYNKLADGSGMTRVTLPGVGVYEATKTNGVNGTFKLVRKDLVAGGYRDEAGHAHFPVMDAQGNVRGYATSDGIQSAYDYFAYGTVMDLSTDAGDDNKRWVPIRVTLAWLKPRSYIEGDILRRLNGEAVLPKQSFGASVQDKEFDGEHGKYYFGSRYFDPFFGMWMSPDPAGQFANPYTYGGDPVNFVDPNGEFAFVPVLISAAIGAIVGGTTAYANCSGKDGCGWKALKMAGFGGLAGAAGGAIGEAFSGVSAAAAGEKGLSVAASGGAAAGSAGTSAAFAGGAVNGAFSGFASSAVTYSLTTDSWNPGHFAIAILYGTVEGGLMGGLTDMFRYELSPEFAFETDIKVMKYANKNGRLDVAAKYVTPGDYQVSIGAHVAENGVAGSEFVANAGEKGTMFLDPINFGKGANFDAEKFFYTAWHEGHHNDMLVSAWKKDGGIGSLSNWVNTVSESDWANHTATQEYINTDPARIKYYKQMSRSTKDFIEPLTEKARNRGYRRMLKYYENLGY